MIAQSCYIRTLPLSTAFITPTQIRINAIVGFSENRGDNTTTPEPQYFVIVPGGEYCTRPWPVTGHMGVGIRVMNKEARTSRKVGAEGSEGSD